MFNADLVPRVPQADRCEQRPALPRREAGEDGVRLLRLPGFILGGQAVSPHAPPGAVLREIDYQRTWMPSSAARPYLQTRPSTWNNSIHHRPEPRAARPQRALPARLRPTCRQRQLDDAALVVRVKLQPARAHRDPRHPQAHRPGARVPADLLQAHQCPARRAAFACSHGFFQSSYFRPHNKAIPQRVVLRRPGHRARHAHGAAVRGCWPNGWRWIIEWRGMGVFAHG